MVTMISNIYLRSSDGQLKVCQNNLARLIRLQLWTWTLLCAAKHILTAYILFIYLFKKFITENNIPTQLNSKT